MLTSRNFLKVKRRTLPLLSPIYYFEQDLSRTKKFGIKSKGWLSREQETPGFLLSQETHSPNLVSFWRKYHSCLSHYFLRLFFLEFKVNLKWYMLLYTCFMFSFSFSSINTISSSAYSIPSDRETIQ